MLPGCLGCVASLLAWLPVVLSLLARVPWRCGFPLRAVARACLLGDVVLLLRLPWRRGLLARAVALEAFVLALVVALEAWSSFARGCLGGAVSLLSLLPLQRDLFACPVASGGGAFREFAWDF
jgi:hypothetical protein